MAKVLFLSLPLAGHINPSLPLVRELAERGEEVVYYATGAFADRVELAGVRFSSYRNEFLANLKRLPEQLHELPILLMRTTGEILEAHLEEFRAERPEYLITDSVAPWGAWVAEILGIPLVTSISTFAFNRQMMRFAVSHGVRPKSAGLLLTKIRNLSKAVLLGRRLSSRYGVRGPGIGRLVTGSSDLNIVYTSRHFQPRAESFDDRFQFVGPSMMDRGEKEDFPWEQIRHRVVVYVSMGTLFNADEGFYRTCFQAFGDQDCQVLLAVGRIVSPTSVGAVPANFIVQSHVPQLEVLRRATAFVTHGGMNSVNESLFHGVPMLVIPQMSEQAIVGRRVEELGAGLYLAREQVTAERIRRLAGRLLAEDGFRKQAAYIGESLRNAGGVARAADAILRFSRRAG